MSLLDTIVADAMIAEKWIIAELEDEGAKVWALAKTILAAEEPALVADLQKIAALVISSLGADKSVGDILTSVYGIAENLGKSEITKLEGNFASGFVSLMLSEATRAAGATPPA